MQSQSSISRVSLPNYTNMGKKFRPQNGKVVMFMKVCTRPDVLKKKGSAELAEENEKILQQSVEHTLHITI